MHLSTDQKGVAGGSRAREHEHLDLFLCEPMGFRSGACDGHRRSPIGANRSPLYNPCNAMSLRTERLTGFPRFFDLGPLSSIAKGAFCRGSPWVASALPVGRGSKRSFQTRLVRASIGNLTCWFAAISWSGSDGTRTRDLRRDRHVPRRRRLATIDAQSLYSCSSTVIRH